MNKLFQENRIPKIGANKILIWIGGTLCTGAFMRHIVWIVQDLRRECSASIDEYASLIVFEWEHRLRCQAVCVYENVQACYEHANTCWNMHNQLDTCMCMHMYLLWSVRLYAKLFQCICPFEHISVVLSASLVCGRFGAVMWKHLSTICLDVGVRTCVECCVWVGLSVIPTHVPWCCSPPAMHSLPATRSLPPTKLSSQRTHHRRSPPRPLPRPPSAGLLQSC